MAVNGEDGARCLQPVASASKLNETRKLRFRVQAELVHSITPRTGSLILLSPGALLLVASEACAPWNQGPSWRDRR